jgi:hypothetical protein
MCSTGKRRLARSFNTRCKSRTRHSNGTRLTLGPGQKLLGEKHTLLRRVIAPVLHDYGNQDLGVAGNLHKMDVVLRQLLREVGELLVARNRYDVGASELLRLVGLNTVGQVTRLLQDLRIDGFQSVVHAENRLALQLPKRMSPQKFVSFHNPARAWAKWNT